MRSSINIHLRAITYATGRNVDRAKSNRGGTSHRKLGEQIAREGNYRGYVGENLRRKFHTPLNCIQKGHARFGA